jgi:hypothetical protein
MNASLVVAACAVITMLLPPAVAAWSTANRYGGSTEHSYGQTSHTNAYGGSTSHAYGEGTEHTNMYGGSTARAWGGGTEHTNVYGGSTYGAYGYGAAHTTAYGATAYRPPYPAGGAYYPYHPPVAVPYYASSGCYGCAAAAGAVVGMAAGAAVASANTTAAYNAGVAAGASATAYAMGVSYAALPGGCTTANVQGQAYYICGNNWFQPSYGANGVFYRVVPTP